MVFMYVISFSRTAENDAGVSRDVFHVPTNGLYVFTNSSIVNELF